VLKSNLSKYELSDYVHITTPKDRYEDYLKNKKISILFIDADGAIDREFYSFYNHLCDNAYIIIDDVENIVNRFGLRFLRRSAQIDFDRGVKDGKTLMPVAPLGKHMISYIICNFLIDNGFMKLDFKIRNTCFFKRLSGCFLLETLIDLNDLINCVLVDFYKRRMLIQKYFFNIMKTFCALFSEDYFLFENYCASNYREIYSMQIPDSYAKPVAVQSNSLLLKDIVQKEHAKAFKSMINGQCVKVSGNDFFAEPLADECECYLIPIFVYGHFWGFILSPEESIEIDSLCCLVKVIASNDHFKQKAETMTDIYSNLI
jgi:hypothetical protein